MTGMSQTTLTANNRLLYPLVSFRLSLHSVFSNLEK